MGGTPPDNNSTEPTEKHNSGKRAFVLFVLLLVAITALGFYLRARTISPQKPHGINTTEENHADYQRILGETHTGLRLARLSDFLEHTPSSQDTAAARIQHSVLQMHEQRAWAELSEAVYSLTANREEKINARDAYIERWGKLLRGPKLDTLPLTSPKQNVFENTSQDEKAEAPKTARLAGGPKKIKRKAKKRKTRTEKVRRGPAVQARIRKSRKPIYPSRAHRRGIEAVIVLSLTIDERGRVTRVRTIDARANRYRSDFIRAAKRAARRTRFHPKTVNGKPVITKRFKRTYRFSIND